MRVGPHVLWSHRRTPLPGTRVHRTLGRAWRGHGADNRPPLAWVARAWRGHVLFPQITGERVAARRDRHRPHRRRGAGGAAADGGRLRHFPLCGDRGTFAQADIQWRGGGDLGGLLSDMW
eukprot:gene24487-biopygen5927